jgi:hypothetical protein
MTKTIPTTLPTNPCYKGGSTLRRPRTKAFLERVAQYESVERSCAFIHREVEILCSTNPLTSSTTHFEDVQIVGKSIHKHMKAYDQKFRSYRRGLKKEAESNIRLYESFAFVSQAVENPPHSSQTDDVHLKEQPCCPLVKLNQGPETTASIIQMIASFAGIPSDADLEDWRELSLCLSNDKTSRR